MDIADFLFVGQWKVERLTMCSFMQRLGRAARSLSLRATFVLFVEPKYFDYRRQLTTRKRTLHGPDGPEGPEQHPCSPSQIPSNNGAPSQGLDNQMQPTDASSRVRTLDEIKEDRNAVYAEFFHTSQAILATSSANSKPTGVIEPAIEDIVNAEDRELDCRRTPEDITFENGKLRT